MSCNNHEYQSQIEELEWTIKERNEDIYNLECEIETLELEHRLMRARMERLEDENKHLHTMIDGLLLIQQSKDKERVKVIEEVWQNTINKS